VLQCDAVCCSANTQKRKQARLEKEGVNVGDLLGLNEQVCCTLLYSVLQRVLQRVLQGVAVNVGDMQARRAKASHDMS